MTYTSLGIYKKGICLLNTYLQKEFEYINKRIMNELYNE